MLIVSTIVMTVSIILWIIIDIGNRADKTGGFDGAGGGVRGFLPCVRNGVKSVLQHWNCAKISLRLRSCYASHSYNYPLT